MITTNKTLQTRVRKNKQPRGQVERSALNAVAFGAPTAKVICGTEDELRRGLGRMVKIVGRIGGAVIIKTVQDGVVVEVAPLVMEVATAAVGTLTDLVAAQQATGITPGSLLILVAQRGAYYKLYRCAVDASGRITFAQVQLAGRVRGAEGDIDKEVARLLKVLPQDERRALEADYAEIEGEKAKIALARQNQAQKTKAKTALNEKTLSDFEAQGNLLQTVVDLQDGKEVDQATVLAAANTAAQVREPAKLVIPKRRTKR